MEKSLLVLAAGMGSRYGGLKQMDPMGPNGETVLDYSVFDAIRAGFTHVIFVIREDFAKAFREGIGSRFTDLIQVSYAFQKSDDLPAGFAPPAGRQRPWGTSHAVRAARELIDGHFAVINADDFYGANAYQQISEHFDQAQSHVSQKLQYAMVGYYINKTLSDHGAVNRGICSLSANHLEDVEEYLRIARQPSGIITGTDMSDEAHTIPEKTIVSMNFWGLHSNVFPLLEDYFADFLKEKGKSLDSECYIPSFIDFLIKQNFADCTVLETTGSWFGVTYPEDKPHVVKNIRELIGAGEYPENLNPAQ